MLWLSVLSPAEVAGLAVMSLKKGLQCMRPPKQNSHKSKGTLPSIGTLRCICRCRQTGGLQIFLVAKQTLLRAGDKGFRPSANQPFQGVLERFNMKCFLCNDSGCRDGAVVRALASHQCDPGSILRLSVYVG